LNVYRTTAARLAAAALCAALAVFVFAPGVAAKEAGPPGEGVRAEGGRITVQTEGKELRAGDGCVSLSGAGEELRVGDCARDDDAPREPGGGGSAAAGPGSPASRGSENETERCVSRITQRSSSGEATTREKTTGEGCRGRSVVIGARDTTERTAPQGDREEDAELRMSGSEETSPEMSVPEETTAPPEGGDPASGADQYEETTAPEATVGKPPLEERTDPETAPGQVAEETRITSPAPKEPEDNGREETTVGIAISDETGDDASSPGPTDAPESAGEEQYAEPIPPEVSEGTDPAPDETPAEDAYEEDIPTAQLPVRPGPQGPVPVLPETGGIGPASLLVGAGLVAVGAVLGLRGRGNGEDW
jgi:hypothetical protein